MKQQSEDYYNQRPNGGNRMTSWEHLHVALIYAEIDLPKRPKILDLGCASGVGAEIMAIELNAMVIGVDFSFARIARGRERRGEQVFFHLGEITEYLIETTIKYNMITMFDVLEHLDDPTGAIILALHQLLPGGVIFAKVPKNHIDPAHVQVFETQNDFHLRLLPTRSFEYNNGIYGVWEQ